MNSTHTTGTAGDANKNTSAEQEQYLEIPFSEILKSFLKFWWICVILALLGAGVMFYKSYIRFTPSYQSSVTFTVQTQGPSSPGMGITSYSFSYNRATANQLSSSFPSIIKSNILQDIICNDLGLPYFPCKLTASSVSGTNMFTITATGTDAQTTYDVLQSVIRNYPAVAEYVIGNTDLYILNEPEIPTVPSNRFSYRGQILRGALMGFALGLAWVLLYAVMRKTVRSRSDIRHKLNQNCLGVLPEVIFKKYNKKINRAITLTNPMVGDSYMESFRALRNSVLNAAGDHRILMVTSTAPGEGKTTVSVNLATSLTMMNKSVIIVDADIRNPSVSRQFGIQNSARNAEDVHTAKITKLQLSPACSVSVLNFNTDRYQMWKILNLDYLSGLLEQLRQKYDYVIVDTSPIGITSEPAIIAQIVDAALLVVRHDTIRVSRITSSLDTLLSSNVNFLGCVLNQAASGFVGYGTKYYNRYGYGYSSSRKHDTETKKVR